MTILTDRLNGLVTSTAIKPPCKAVAVSNITLSAEQTVNGVAVTDGDRVLVTAQTDATENGIYNVSTSAWQRAADFDGNRDVRQGTLVVVNRSTGQDFFYQVDTADPIVIGTSEITFTLTNDPNVLVPVTEVEITAGLTDDDIEGSYLPGDIRRYGIVANDVNAATTNTTRLQALLDPAVDGPKGRLSFPYELGDDIYYFDGMVEVRTASLSIYGAVPSISRKSTSRLTTPSAF